MPTSVEERENVETVLRNAIKVKYEALGFTEHLPFSVKVNPDEILVILDSEDPYLGAQFAPFVEETTEEFDKALGAKGTVSYFANIVVMKWPAEGEAD